MGARWQPRERRPGAAARRHARWALPLALSLAWPAAHGAAYLPGAEADPPTGDLPPQAPMPAEPMQGGDIAWTFGPWRSNGTVALDFRALRLDHGARSRQTALLLDIDSASYLWQPWFIQVRLGAGLIATSDHGSASDANAGGIGKSLTGRAELLVFPASRFPFSLRAEASDTRAAGDGLGSDYRMRRLSALQSYQPETGNDRYQLQIDASELLAESKRDSDTLVVIDAQALQLRGAHRFELGANWSRNERGDDSVGTRIARLSARHGYNPSPLLSVESMASWNELRLRQHGDAADTEIGTEVRQLSSLLTWRPREGDLPFAVSPATMVVGSARWVETRALGSPDAARLAALAATLGLSTDLSPTWRAAASMSFNQFDAAEGTVRNAGLGASANWASRGQAWGAWRYLPTLALSVGVTRGDARSEQDFATAQFSHSVVRDLGRDAGDVISLVAAQSLGVGVERNAVRRAAAGSLVHSLGLTWQSGAGSARQSFASATVSDSRSQSSDERAGFQLVNLQWNQRTQLGRMSSWSGSLTLQAARSTLTQDDAATGRPSTTGGEWQTFANGTLSVEHRRLFDVPRLRGTLLASVSTQQLQRRSAGDIDAPVRFVSHSLEGRLDYAIGRLEARLSARVARVDDKNVASLFARVQRRF
ncbi:MAG TPA: hypothetical protein VFQ16_08835 [Burkholderiaceae bacterium]|nr:hypothetical protein [Burkholderiaceae bacterium]